MCIRDRCKVPAHPAGKREVCLIKKRKLMYYETC